MILKVCGITRLKDAIVASRAGATHLGFVFYKDSPRYIDPERAMNIMVHLRNQVKFVGVFVGDSTETVRDIATQLNLDMIQLHGGENPDDYRVCGRPIMMATDLCKDLHGLSADHILIDSSLGAEKVRETFAPPQLNPQLARASRSVTTKAILSGGLDQSNIKDVLTQFCPEGVDVSRGVEISPGVKDDEKIMAFCRAVKGYYEAS